MANSESTAVNALIDLVSAKPLRRDSEVDLFSIPVTPQVQPPARVAPVTRSVAESRFHNARVSPPISRTHAIPAIQRSVAIPASPRAVAIAPRESRPSNEDTHAVVRPQPIGLSKLVLPMALVILVGVLIGGYVAFNGEARHAASAALAATAPAPIAPATPEATTLIAPTAAPIAPAAPIDPVAVAPTIAPAPTPTIAPAPDTTAEPIVAVESPARLADVLLESQPSGATVMMVDRGVNTTIGNTPIRISIDPSHEVDLVFSLANHATRVEHLDPRTHNRLAIALDGPAPPPIAAARTAQTKPTTVAVAPAHHHAGNGVLMISSKPPCAIFVDGKATGLTTPQRSLTLPAGNHQITLVNSEQKIKKTVGVQITTDHTTKLTRDLMKT